jgi:hypothetical protein
MNLSFAGNSVSSIYANSYSNTAVAEGDFVKVIKGQRIVAFS